MQYVIGDATDPQGDGNKIIVHCCNNVGAWGAGFVMALSARWSKPEEYYKWWATRSGPGYIPFVLGQVQHVRVEPGLWVANLIGQNGVRNFKNPRPIDYDALAVGFVNVSENAVRMNASVHMPRIGCGLAGGDWNVVESIIDMYMDPDLDITVYDLEQNAN
jgi:O-acetyl-ADP-ribose deacetylase (regulator of RNase III)